MTNKTEAGEGQLHTLRGFGIGSSFGLPQLCIQAWTSSQGTPIRVRSNSARRRSSSSRASGDDGPSPLACSFDCDLQATAVRLRMTPVLRLLGTPKLHGDSPAAIYQSCHGLAIGTILGWIKLSS